MTGTALKIMELFSRHAKVEPGMVLPVTELSCKAKGWGRSHFSALEKAMEELKDEGYVIITSPHGLELTERGYEYLMGM